MKINLPWIKSRQKIILSIFIDILSFLYFFLFSNEFASNKELIISTYILKLIIIWIMVSYILGRYHTSLRKASDYLNYLLKTALVSILSHSILFFILIFFESQIDWLESISIIRYSIIFSFLISNTFQLILSLILIKKFTIIGEVIFISSNKNLKSITNLSNYGLKKINYQLKNEDYIIEKKNHKKINSYVLSDINNLEENTQKIIRNLHIEGYRIYTILSWSEKVLECLPSSLLSNSDIIKGDLRIRKDSFQFRLKRLGDFSFSIFLLLATSPIILIFAILIKLQDGGPAFYSQKRTGLNGKEFNIYKLRSMKKNAEKDKPLWSKDNDPRVTFIGKFIRRTRIDELPQLWCVINGSMSLIGPRPERPKIEIDLERKIKYYRLRHSIKPGLSGWAQVKYKYGNSILDSEIKLSYDLYYLRHFSFWLDLLIMIKTIRIIINSNLSFK